MAAARKNSRNKIDRELGLEVTLIVVEWLKLLTFLHTRVRSPADKKHIFANGCPSTRFQVSAIELDEVMVMLRTVLT